MDVPEPIEAAPKKKGLLSDWREWSLAKKILVSIAIALVSLTVLLMVAFVYGLYWLRSPGKTIEARAVVGPSSVGFVTLHASIDDPGVSALIETLVKRLSTLQQHEEEAAGPFRVIAKIQELNLQNTVREFWPESATVSIEQPGEDHSAWVGALNLSGGRGVLAIAEYFIAHSDEGPFKKAQRSEHRGYKLFRFGAGAVAFSGSSILGADDQAALRAMIDRIEDPPPPREPPPQAEPASPKAGARFEPLSSQLEAGTDIHGVFQKPSLLDSGLIALAGRLCDGLDCSDTLATATSEAGLSGFSVDFIDADRTHGTIVFSYPSAASAESARARVGLLARRIAGKAKEAGLKLQIAEHASGEDLEIEVDLRGVQRLIEQKLTPRR